MMKVPHAKRPSTVSKRTTNIPNYISRAQILKYIKENPYQLPNDHDLLKFRENSVLSAEEQRNKMRNQRLMDRGFDKLHSFNEGRPSSTIEEDEIPPVANEHQRRVQMNGFIGKSREILLAQIKIDRKLKEVERILQQQQTEQNIIENQMTKIAETNNQYEMTASSLRSEIARCKKDLDNAMTMKTQLAKELKTKRESVAKIKAEITKNEDIVFQYRNYGEFMHSLAPDNEDPLKHFSSPEVLIAEMKQLESENLFLIRRCSEMAQKTERTVGVLKEKLQKALDEKAVLKSLKSKIQPVMEEIYNNSQIEQESEDVSAELDRLSMLIKTTYNQCFENKLDMNSLMMLEKLELALEEKYSMIDNIPKNIVLDKQAQIDRIRREQIRVERNIAKAKEQKKKMEAALARATKPIKKRLGRQLKERMLPISTRKKPDNSQKALDDKIQEEFLFGPIQY